MQNTATMKFNELEWRSDAVQASAGQMISRVAAQSKVAFYHYRFLVDLRDINKRMIDLLEYIHSPQAIRVLESSSPEEREHVGVKMHDVACKVRIMICQLRAADFGFWKDVYATRLEKLNTANQELYCHADAFRAIDSSLILLSKKDQDFLLESLATPDEPNDALRRAMMR